MKRGAWFLTFVVTLGTIVVGAWVLYRRAAERENLYRQAQLLDEVVNSIANLYVDSLTGADLYQLAIDGLLRSLGDPYAGYFEDEAFARQNELTSGTYAGIGIRVESSDGWITVVSPLTGSPAERAGIQAGDRIVAVDGEPVQGWTPDQSSAALRGEQGTTVELTVVRPGVNELLPFTVERAEIEVSAVRHRQQLEPGLGYVWLEIVNARSAEALRAAIDSLRTEGADKLILDLRRNPGGLLREAVAITDLFLDKGESIVETRARTARDARTFRAREDAVWPDLIVAVLVDEYSASASEIIAGALQDHDRALVLGRPTFGKGVYQSVFPIGRDEALKFTTGRWYTPLGRSIERDSVPEPGAGGDSIDVVVTELGRRIQGGGGVHPDVLVEIRDTVELTLTRALGTDYQAFRRVVADYAATLAARPDSAESPDLNTLRNQLAAAGVVFSGRQWEAVGPGVERQLQYHRARLAGGEPRELAARLADDPMVALAVERLRRANSTADLLELPGR